jgi:ribosomal protein S18 acetylase RimI-like enzyme
MSYLVRAFVPGDRSALRAHLARHRGESGRGDPHFMPFTPIELQRPREFDLDATTKALTEVGWQRWFIAIAASGEIVGNLDLNGDGLETSLHRCELGIGIERPHRRAGLGRQLMEAAIGFAKQADTLVWLDLHVFGHNAPAIALYRSLGFAETGRIEDRFRVEGQSIDDLLMTLPVGQS